MPTDLRPGPNSPPLDELDAAERSLTVLQQAVHGIADDDLSKQTPCREYDIAGLTDHLMRSITGLGGAAGAEFPERDSDDSVERQLIAAARPALDAWRRRGLDGTAKFGSNEAPAKVFAGILAIEFLVHGWDYAAALGRPFEVPDSLTDYVYELTRLIITPEGRKTVGFDDPVDVPDDAGSMQRLLAFTGRRPSD
jgi:uncharacterized protein (TIGR03086 family)